MIGRYSLEGEPIGIQPISGGAPDETEALRRGVELRVGDFERDAEPLARLYSHPDIIGHLAGVAPMDATDEEIKRVRRRYPNLTFFIATPEGIRDFYEKNPHLDLIVAQNADGGIIGSVTVEKPGLGLTVATLARLAVDPQERGRGVGDLLVVQGCEYIFASSREGGLGYTQARANVIKDVEGYQRALSVFVKHGFGGVMEFSDSCASWDSSQGRFISRGAVWTRLSKDAFQRIHQGRDTSQDFFRGPQTR
ncbi:MAG: GNAT family N-acetyltransferase [Candidatus Levybacteria bacterium]|nr:GNAT family N-acetyltransferase [Candidatus Levybacteria bacterium]